MNLRTVCIPCKGTKHTGKFELSAASKWQAAVASAASEFRLMSMMWRGCRKLETHCRLLS